MNYYFFFCFNNFSWCIIIYIFLEYCPLYTTRNIYRWKKQRMHSLFQIPLYLKHFALASMLSLVRPNKSKKLPMNLRWGGGGVWERCAFETIDILSSSRTNILSEQRYTVYLGIRKRQNINKKNCYFIYQVVILIKSSLKWQTLWHYSDK